MAEIQEEQKLAELNQQIFGNPLILSKILECFVTEMRVTNPELASVHHITRFSLGAPPEASCRKLITKNGNLLRQVNREWETTVINLFNKARFPLNLIAVNENGLLQLQQETHVPFALKLEHNYDPQNNTLTERILELGRSSLVELQLQYPDIEQTQPSFNERMKRPIIKPMKCPQLPQSLPSVRKLTIKCPLMGKYADKNWKQFVQDTLDKCVKLKELQVLTIEPWPQSREKANEISNWKYPVCTKHLALTDLYLPPVDAPALQNLVSLCIIFTLETRYFHEQLITLLEGCKDSLQELIMIGDRLGHSRIRILSMPVLPNLITLITNQKVQLYDAEQGFGLEGKVPKLEHLAVEWSLDYNFPEDLLKGWIGHRQINALESVKRFSWNISQDLSVYEPLVARMSTFLPQLNAMLPNVKLLEILLPDLYLSGLSLIFEKMVQLTGLKIDVWNKRFENNSDIQTTLWESLLIGETVNQENLKKTKAGLNNLNRLEVVSFGSKDKGHLLSLHAITTGLLPIACLRKLILRERFKISLEAAEIWKGRGRELIVVKRSNGINWWSDSDNSDNDNSDSDNSDKDNSESDSYNSDIDD